jgi:hypothetical protein
MVLDSCGPTLIGFSWSGNIRSFLLLRPADQ